MSKSEFTQVPARGLIVPPIEGRRLGRSADVVTGVRRQAAIRALTHQAGHGTN